MGLHTNPAYNHERLQDALRSHGLPVDKPSQTADAFRLGWTAAIREANAHLNAGFEAPAEES